MAQLARFFPPACQVTRSPTTHAGRSGVGQEGAADARRGGGAGLRRDVPVPAEHPLHPDPDHRGADRAARHLRLAAPDRASRSTCSPCSAWCWPSASSWTTPSWWSRTSSGSWPRRGCRRRRPPRRPWVRSPAPSSASPLVLMAVFVPMAFFPGSVGIIYRSSRSPWSTSIAFSAFLALSLTPALCATLLKPIEGPRPRQGGRFRLVQPPVPGLADAPLRHRRRAGWCAGAVGPLHAALRGIVGGLGYALTWRHAHGLPAHRGPGLRHGRRSDATFGRECESHPRRGPLGRGTARSRSRASTSSDDAARLRLLGPGARRPGLRHPEGLVGARCRTAPRPSAPEPTRCS
jgi:hypothetical protein